MSALSAHERGERHPACPKCGLLMEHNHSHMFECGQAYTLPPDHERIVKLEARVYELETALEELVERVGGISGSMRNIVFRGGR